MLKTKVTIGFLVCATIFALNVYSQTITSSAKNLKDMETEVLAVINSNKNLTMHDLVPKLHNQVSAALANIKSAGGYPSQTEITNTVADLIKQLPKDGPITGESVQRFEKGITAHLNRTFPPKSGN